MSKYALLILISILIGITIPVLPIEILSRGYALVFSLLTLIVCWILRSNNIRIETASINKFLALVIVFSCIWPRYVFYKFGPLPRVNPFNLSTAFSVLMILLLLIVSSDFWKKYKETAKYGALFYKLIALWFGFRLISCMIGDQPFPSLVFYFREMMYISSFILIGIAWNMHTDAQDRLIKILILCSLFIGFSGLYEYFVQYNPFIGLAIKEDDPFLFDALKSISSDKSRGGAYRSQSIFSHPIVFSQFMSAILPLAIYGLAKIKGSHWKSVFIVAIVLSVTSVYVSGSRSGYIGLVVGIAVFATVIWVKMIKSGYLSKILSILLAPVIVIGGVVFYGVAMTLISGQSATEAGSGQIRISMLIKGLNALAERPLLGFGDGRSTEIAGNVTSTGMVTIDNHYLSLLVDNGVIGFSMFVSAMIWLIYKSAVSSLKEDLQGNDGLFVLALLSSIMSILVTFSIVSIYDNMSLVWLLSTTIIACIRKQEKSPI